MSKASHIIIGKQGESVASKYLYDIGYEILEHNWRHKKAEIDIIAREGQTIVFVEVKTKSYTDFGDPSESVNKTKERLIIDAASQYCISIQHEWEIRFDIISVIITKDGHTTLDHYKDAFYPGLNG
jgi:putative endonuclease